MPSSGAACPFVSVVVPTRNRARALSNLLAALEGQDYPAYEVIVVDDASDDETPAILSKWKGERRSWLRLDAPSGRAAGALWASGPYRADESGPYRADKSGPYAARNRGWRMARGDVIAFTDDDCLPQPQWLSALVRALPGAAGVQGVTLAQPGEITPFTHQIEQRRPGPPYRTCNVAYPRAILERLDGFDQSFRWYADNILGLRARQLGPIAFAPDAVVLHPPRPKEWRTRSAWLARFDADRRHRQELHRLGVEPAQVPGKALPLVLWILRPFLKQALAHGRYLLRHPLDYLRQAPPMLEEKRELVLALRAYWRAPHPPAPSPSRGEGETGTVEGEASETEKANGGSPPSPLEGVLDKVGVRGLVSVVIVTRDRPELLAAALDALGRQTWARREVIVVDNGCSAEQGASQPSVGCGSERSSGDSAPGAVETVARSRGARYVTAAGSTLGAARQRGVDAARGEIIAFTDDDCLPDERWLEVLVSTFRRQPGLAGVQGRTEAEAGPVGSHAIRVAGPDRLYRTCNIAYRREALELAGGFDPGFQGWFEDTALAARVLERGPIGFEPGARVTHRAMPRRRLGRERWRVVLADERRLADTYPSFYRRARGPGFLSAVIARWLVGSPLKTLTREWRGMLIDPRGYLALARLLLEERRELLAALLIDRRHLP